MAHGIVNSYTVEEIAEFKKVLEYCPVTGVIRWIANNTVAGTKNKDGYIRIAYKEYRIMAHRLAWMFYYGEDPHPFVLDHINRVVNDNRIANLRKVSAVENSANRGPYKPRKGNKPVFSIEDTTKFTPDTVDTSKSLIVIIDGKICINSVFSSNIDALKQMMEVL